MLVQDQPPLNGKGHWDESLISVVRMSYFRLWLRDLLSTPSSDFACMVLTSPVRDETAGRLTVAHLTRSSRLSV